MTTEFSSEVLEKTPERVAKFLTAIGAKPTIRTVLAKAGMDDDAITEGRTLLLDCLAAPGPPAAQTDTPDAKKQRDAVAELDEWDGPNFGRYHAALRRFSPSAADYVFHELSAATGSEAVTAVATFLARLDTLEQGSDEARADEREEDKAAVALLAERRLDADERRRLQGLVDLALGPVPLAPGVPPSDAAEVRMGKLTALKLWFDDWAATARAVVKRRDYRIRLGLAHRRSPEPSGGE